jgi:hypothetical protein
MQQKQVSFKPCHLGMVLISIGILTGQAALAADNGPRQSGDPILDGGPAGPCDPGRNGADYVAGTDANGHPVAPADLAAAPNPVPDRMLIPLKTAPGRDPAYVQADGKKLDGLLNPPSACPVPAKPTGG